MKENKIALWLIVLVIIIIAIALGLYSYAFGTKSQLIDASVHSETKSFVVIGKRLSSVDVMIIPTGTNITEKDHQKLTSMILTKGDENDQEWTAHLPTQQFLAAGIYVKAYDSNKKEIGRKTLPYTGATEIYNMFSPFWATTPAVASSTKPVVPR